MSNTILPERDRYCKCLVQASRVIRPGKSRLGFATTITTQAKTKRVTDTLSRSKHDAAYLRTCWPSTPWLSIAPIKCLKVDSLGRSGTTCWPLENFWRKLEDKLASLKDEPRPKHLDLKSTFECRQPDGSVLLGLDDPFDEILTAIRGYLRRTADLGEQADGQSLGFQFYLLSDLVERFNPPLSIKDQKAVCHDLFDRVHERNEDELHNYDKMLRRIGLKTARPLQNSRSLANTNLVVELSHRRR